MTRSLYARLKAQYPGITSRKLKTLIREGAATVNGEVVREPAARVGDQARTELSRTALEGKAQRKPLVDRMRVVYEDDDLIVVEKAPGILVQPTEAREEGTLVELVRHYWRMKSKAEREANAGGKLRTEFALRSVHVVHRIDKDTSGLVVFAKNADARAKLSQQFRQHTIERKYLALIEGRLSPRRGKIESVIARDRGDRRRGSARGGATGKVAITYYEVIEQYGNASLLALRLKTGRQHQIRIHLSEKGRPVIGERVYLPKGWTPKITHTRHALHAATLAFAHPRTGERVRFESQLPTDLAEVQGRLRAQPKATS